MYWKEIVSILEFIGNICVIAITIYTFYLGFLSKRISVVSVRHSYSQDGDSIKISLKNHSMKTISLKKISCIYDNKYEINVIDEYDEDGPFIIDPFGLLHINMKPFSYLDNHKLSEFTHEGFYCLLEMFDGKILYAQFRKGQKINKKASIETIPVIRNYCNEQIILPGHKYALTYKQKDGKLKTLFIYANGFMTDSLTQYNEKTKELSTFNKLPQEIVSNISTLNPFFTELFKPFEIIFRVDEIDN